MGLYLKDDKLVVSGVYPVDEAIFGISDVATVRERLKRRGPVPSPIRVLPESLKMMKGASYLENSVRFLIGQYKMLMIYERAGQVKVTSELEYDLGFQEALLRRRCVDVTYDDTGNVINELIYYDDFGHLWVLEQVDYAKSRLKGDIDGDVIQLRPVGEAEPVIIEAWRRDGTVRFYADGKLLQSDLYAEDVALRMKYSKGNKLQKGDGEMTVDSAVFLIKRYLGGDTEVTDRMYDEAVGELLDQAEKGLFLEARGEDIVGIVNEMVGADASVSIHEGPQDAGVAYRIHRPNSDGDVAFIISAEQFIRALAEITPQSEPLEVAFLLGSFYRDC